MSANRLKHSQSGFTLIEVTLAIVIGVVVIAGATVLYNQAKASAALTAAQSKVNAAAASVEEFSARNFGRYPTDAQFETVWKRNRPDDYNSSPWGGQAGNGGTAGKEGMILGTALGTGIADLAAANALTNVNKVGAIEYRISATNATASVFDLQTSSNKTVRGYGLWIYSDKGEGPNFVTGGK
jgi:prepilin-type N-terminal cleavage/methylation domain-containing protein